ncbi:TPM domain-containing protein [Rufibacter latericius]|uniref:TPM domain-containing protein n=1 Tax=Rufibacter latericius TaxID=2487040 RepID=A0A3M9MDR2_9BACT|nr:TPM domain-containing protein [Rufibacter latericius]RNI23711.1 TPM domain-containing protein [Rufibacter latericius]
MRKSIWLLGVLWLWAGLGLAQDFPPRPSPPRLVNDLANILSPEEEQALEQKLVNYSDSTSTQIAVVNTTSIGGYDISDYAFKLAEQWGIGQQGKNNGILILTAVNERRVFIATGYGMEGVVPDAIAKRITEYTIKPEYQQGRYYAGLDKGTSFIIDVASGEYKADPKQRQGQDEGGFPFLWIIIGILILIFIISRRGGGGRGGRGGMRTLGGPFFPPVIFGDFSGGRGIFGGGGGGFGGGGGGGFGGFGGGSFGGGGAGSDW